jgi:ADP-ribosyl-[dinitrogen reductase] hydrolase
MTVPSRSDAAVGAMLGAFVGDAAGAVLEFAGVPSEAAVEAAMRMPGGGVLSVGRGQVTDDSEMALCLAQVRTGPGRCGTTCRIM